MIKSEVSHWAGLVVWAHIAIKWVRFRLCCFFHVCLSVVVVAAAAAAAAAFGEEFVFVCLFGFVFVLLCFAFPSIVLVVHSLLFCCLFVFSHKGFSGDVFGPDWLILAYQPYFTLTASNVAYGWWSHDLVCVACFLSFAVVVVVVLLLFEFVYGWLVGLVVGISLFDVVHLKFGHFLIFDFEKLFCAIS